MNAEKSPTDNSEKKGLEKPELNKRKPRKKVSVRHIEIKGVRYRNKLTEIYDPETNSLIEQINELHDTDNRKVSLQTEKYNPKNNRLTSVIRIEYSQNNQKVIEEQEEYEYNQINDRLKTRKYIRYENGQKKLETIETFDSQSGQIIERTNTEYEDDQKTLETIETFDSQSGQIIERTNTEYEDDQKTLETIETFDSQSGQIIERTNTEYEDDQKTLETIETFDPQSGNLIKLSILLYENNQKKSEEVEIYDYDEETDKATSRKDDEQDTGSPIFLSSSIPLIISSDNKPPKPPDKNKATIPRNRRITQIIYIKHGKGNQKQSEVTKTFDKRSIQPKQTIVFREANKIILKKVEVFHDAPDYAEPLIEKEYLRQDTKKESTKEYVILEKEKILDANKEHAEKEKILDANKEHAEKERNLVAKIERIKQEAAMRAEETKHKAEQNKQLKPQKAETSVKLQVKKSDNKDGSNVWIFVLIIVAIFLVILFYHLASRS